MDEIVEIAKIKTPHAWDFSEASGVCVCGRLALQAGDEVLYFLRQHAPDRGRDGLLEIAGHSEEAGDGDEAGDSRDGSGDTGADRASAGVGTEARLTGLF